MKKYILDSTINEFIARLNEMASKEKDVMKIVSILEEIDKLNIISQHTNFNLNTENLSTMQNFERIKKWTSNISFLWEPFKEFYNLTFSQLPEIPPEKKIMLANKTILEITHDFYQSLDKNFYSKFLKLYNKADSHVFFDQTRNDGEGITYYLKNLNEVIMFIYRDCTINDIFTTIHESGHAIGVFINPQNMHHQKYFFGEIESIFMELIAAEYLESIFKNGYSILNRIKRHDHYCSKGIDIVDRITLVEFNAKINGFKNGKALKSTAYNKFMISNNELKKLLNISDLYNESAVISYMFAINLYYLYREDSEKALYILNQIILLQCESTEEYYYRIQELGLNPLEYIKTYHEEVTNDLLTLTKKPNNQ